MAEKLPMIHRSSFLLPPTTTNSQIPATYALIILNQRLPRFSPLLWDHAKVRLCADGGANRLFDDMPELCGGEHGVRERCKPDVIKGDMDSIRPDVLNYYRDLGTKIVDNSDDQDTTDLHKCITYILDFFSDERKSNLCILVAGALGGRFDHEMGNINMLCRFQQHGLFFCLMVVLFNFFLVTNIMRLASFLRLKALIVALFPLVFLAEALRLPGYNGILITQK